MDKKEVISVLKRMLSDVEGIQVPETLTPESLEEFSGIRKVLSSLQDRLFELVLEDSCEGYSGWTAVRSELRGLATFPFVLN